MAVYVKTYIKEHIRFILCMISKKLSLMQAPSSGRFFSEKRKPPIYNRDAAANFIFKTAGWPGIGMDLRIPTNPNPNPNPKLIPI